MGGDDLALARLVEELHRALHYLYEPAELRRSPLVGMFALQGAKDPAAALRRILTEAIEALKPGDEVPLQAGAWRIYHVLFQRYTEQFTQREVAGDLGLSSRQLRRLENTAIELLAEHLRAHYDLSLPAPARQEATPAAPTEAGTPSREQELAWLCRSLPSDPVDLGQLLAAALRVVTPLTQSLGVQVDCTVPASLPHLAVPEALLRQALLNGLMAAIRCTPGGRVKMEAHLEHGRVALRIAPRAAEPVETASPQAGDLPVSTAGRGEAGEDPAENLAMARQLIEPVGGTMEILPGEGEGSPFSARLLLPAVPEATVLVIDDNADTLQLLERYLVGSCYRFSAVADPQRALAAAEAEAPEIIVLDVMLPGIDGWELLGRLREHPATRDVPILVCTILPQEHLALGLGAAGFIRKPVSREDFLAALDAQTWGNWGDQRK